MAASNKSSPAAVVGSASSMTTTLDAIIRFIRSMTVIPFMFSFEKLLKSLKKQEDQLHHPIFDTLLSWMIAVLCFVYYGFRFVLMKWKQHQMCHLPSSPSSCHALIPLMTHSRNELDRHDAIERIKQLQTYLDHHHHHNSNQATKSCSSNNNGNNKNNNKASRWIDEDLTSLIRSQEVPRRLASLIILRITARGDAISYCAQEDDDLVQLSWQLQRIWPAILPLPPVPYLVDEKASVATTATTTTTTINSNNGHDTTKCFDIALIVPAYRERGAKVHHILQKALMACHSPQNVQVLVIDAGENIGLQQDELFTSSYCYSSDPQQSQPQQSQHLSQRCSWGQTRVLVYSGGGGRGPCLNYGARHANALVYTFLHSDTTLPQHWDQSVKQALLPQKDNSFSSSKLHHGRPIVNHACAFTFGIHTTREGLDGQCYPYGINAIHYFLGNLRASLFSMPYGDHVISMAATSFWYIGGYPDQAIMEDYELMHLLRQRAAASSLLLHNNGDERLKILPSRANCSPRRWQRYGVPYVTLANAYCVYQYECGMTPDDLYRYYYSQPPPQRKSEQSPWEVSFKDQLQQ